MELYDYHVFLTATTNRLGLSGVVCFASILSDTRSAHFNIQLLQNAYHNTYKVTCCYFIMTAIYLKHLREFRDDLNTRVDNGTKLLMIGKYREAEKVFKAVYDEQSDVSKMSRLEQNEDQGLMLVSQAKRTYLRGCFGYGLSRGPEWGEGSLSIEDVGLMGNAICIYTDNDDDLESIEDRYKFLGNGMGALGFMKEGLQILLDSKYKDFDSCVSETILKLGNIHSQFTPMQFGFSDSLERFVE